jgi:FAD/FMN-containing dehydrogenase
MEALRVTTRLGAERALQDAANAGYDEARTVRNGMIDHHPEVIACCAGAADVLAGVRFARDHDLLVSVRGGATVCGMRGRPDARPLAAKGRAR